MSDWEDQPLPGLESVTVDETKRKKPPPMPEPGVVWWARFKPNRYPCRTCIDLRVHGSTSAVAYGSYRRTEGAVLEYFCWLHGQDKMLEDTKAGLWKSKL